MSPQANNVELPEREVEAGKIGIVLVEPFPVVREALAVFLGNYPDLQVIVASGSADDVLSTLARGRRPRSLVGLIAVIAVELGGEHDAYWLIHELRERFPQMRIAATGSEPDRMAVSRALFVGADAFIGKRSDPAPFVEAIRQTLSGKMVLEGVPMDWLGPISDAITYQQEGSFLLTPRERHVLSVAAEGLRAREIAERLSLSERTVTTHLARIYEKLGVHSRVAAITTAARSGLVAVAGFSELEFMRDVG